MMEDHLITRLSNRKHQSSPDTNEEPKINDVPMDPFIDTGLSPLEQIRHAEAEVTRRVASARQAAEKTLIKARAQASKQKAQAREEGLRQGQAQYQAAITSAEEEARQILAQSQKQADSLLLRGEVHLYAAVCQAVDIILGMEGGEKKDYEH